MKIKEEWNGSSQEQSIIGNIKPGLEQLKNIIAQVTDPVVKQKLEKTLSILLRKTDLLNQRSSADPEEFQSMPDTQDIMHNDKLEEKMNKKQKIKALTEIITKETKKILEEAKKKAKKKKLKIEGMTVEGHQNVTKDDVGRFYVVTGAKNGSTNENIMFETDVFNLAEKINSGGLRREDVRAIVRDGNRAKRLGEKFLKERESQVGDATKKAEGLKNLRDEVRGQVDTIKKTQKETVQAVNKLRK